MILEPTNNLPFLIPNWKGNPIDIKKKFVNIDEPSEKSFKELFKWFRGNNPYKALKKNQKGHLNVISHNELPSKSQDSICWLGHASFIITLNGFRILTDPVLFDIQYLKRFTILPFNPKHFLDIDFILVSHNHRDHADAKSIKLLTKQNPNAKIFCGLKMKTLIQKWAPKNEITEMGWYQRFTLKDLNIDYLPARHWARRGIRDMNNMLWGSFMVSNKNSHIYFGADSGLGAHFQTLSHLYPTIDYALLGIGAYEPEWFMAAAHTSPSGALQAAHMLNAKCLIPSHYGSFDLSDEPVYYPLEVLKKLIPAAKCEVNCLPVGKLLLI